MQMDQVKIMLSLLLVSAFLTYFYYANHDDTEGNFATNVTKMYLEPHDISIDHNNSYLLRNLSTMSSVYSKDVATAIGYVARRGYPNSSVIVPPFIRLESLFRVAPQYHIGYCHIEKSMCSIMDALLCYLYDSDSFVHNNRSISTDLWKSRFCYGKGEYESTQQLVNEYAQMLDVIFITRDPLQRFLSGFVDKCINEATECYGCNKSVTCTVDKLYEELINNTSSGYFGAPYTAVISYEGIHMAPQNWHCDIWGQGEEYTYIKYGEDHSAEMEMKQTLFNVLRNHGVEQEKISYIENSLLARTGHTTKASSARKQYEEELLRSPDHMKKFLDIFYYDYLLFGYRAP